MTADSTDRRDALARVIAVRMANTSNLPDWMQTAALGRDMTPLGELAADAVIEHLRATGPARDGGLRAAVQKVHDEWAATAKATWPVTREVHAALNQVVAFVEDLRAALAASPAPGGDLSAALDVLPEPDLSVEDALEADEGEPAPGGDTAPREDDGAWTYLQTLREMNPSPRLLRAIEAAEAALRDDAARPVPPGPAATRDGEAGECDHSWFVERSGLLRCANCGALGAAPASPDVGTGDGEGT